MHFQQLHYTSAEKPWNLRATAARKRYYFRYLANTAWRGAWPRGMRWYHCPEFWRDRALDRIGLDYTWIVRLASKVRRAVERISPRGPFGRSIKKAAQR